MKAPAIKGHVSDFGCNENSYPQRSHNLQVFLKIIRGEKILRPDGFIRVCVIILGQGIRNPGFCSICSMTDTTF